MNSIDTNTSCDNLRSIKAWLDRLARRGFYGVTSFRWDCGRIIHVKAEVSIKPDNLTEPADELGVRQHDQR